MCGTLLWRSSKEKTKGVLKIVLRGSNPNGGLKRVAYGSQQRKRAAKGMIFELSKKNCKFLF